MVSGSASTGVVPLVGLGTFPVGVVVADSVVAVVSPDTGSEAIMVRPSVQRASGTVEDGTGVVVATFVAAARGLVFLVVGVLVAIGDSGVVFLTTVVVGDGEVKISAVAIVVPAIVVTGRDVASIVAVTSGVAVTVVGVFVPFVVAGVVTTEVTTVVDASAVAVVTAWVAAAGAVGVGVGSLSSSSHMALPVRPPVLRRNKACTLINDSIRSIGIFLSTHWLSSNPLLGHDLSLPAMRLLWKALSLVRSSGWFFPHGETLPSSNSGGLGCSR